MLPETSVIQPVQAAPDPSTIDITAGCTSLTKLRFFDNVAQYAKENPEKEGGKIVFPYSFVTNPCGKMQDFPQVPPTFFRRETSFNVNATCGRCTFTMLTPPTHNG